MGIEFSLKRGKGGKICRKAVVRQLPFVNYRIAQARFKQDPSDLLDRLIVQNDYNRALLFSGADGFDFFDDRQKQALQTC